MIRLLAFLLLASLMACKALAIDTTVMPDQILQQRYRDLTHELRCMTCQNQTIADSPVGLASDLRREVKELLLAGKSDDEVRDYMVARYGEFILFKPRYSVRNAWLWLAPILFLALGSWVAVRIVRQRAALVEQDSERLDEEAQR